MALAAATMTTNVDKIRALARALAAAATDDARIDPEMLAVAALADMEAAHVKVWRFMAQRSPHHRGPREMLPMRQRHREDLRFRVGEVAGVLDPVLATLLRHGVIEEHSRLQDSLRERERDARQGFGDRNAWQPEPPALAVTRFGKHCLDLLEAVNAEEQQPAQAAKPESDDGGRRATRREDHGAEGENGHYGDGAARARAAGRDLVHLHPPGRRVGSSGARGARSSVDRIFCGLSADCRGPVAL